MQRKRVAKCGSWWRQVRWDSGKPWRKISTGASLGPMSTTSCSTPVESVTRCCSKSPIIALLHWNLLVSFRNQSGGDWCGWPAETDEDRKSIVWGRSVSVSVDFGGSRYFKKK